MKREKNTADRFGEGKKKRGDRLRYVGGVILFALLYDLLAGIAFEFFSEETHIPLIWIPGGFSLGVLLRFGLRYWPGIILAILAPSYYYTASAGFTLGIAANNTFTAILGAVMLRSVAGFDVRMRARARCRLANCRWRLPDDICERIGEYAAVHPGSR